MSSIGPIGTSRVIRSIASPADRGAPTDPNWSICSTVSSSEVTCEKDVELAGFEPLTPHGHLGWTPSVTCDSKRTPT